MTLWLSLLLAAAPVDVVVVHGEFGTPATLGVLKKALVGWSPTDASEVHRLLFGGGFGNVGTSETIFWDFEYFAQKPPDSWPEPLKQPWADALHHCKEFLGPPPWKETFHLVQSCATRFASFMWTSFLAQLGAGRVLVVHVRETRETSSLALEAALYRATERSARVVQASGPRASHDALIADVTSQLLEGKGTRTDRTVVTAPFVTAREESELYKVAAVEPPTPLKQTCAGLPQALTLEGKGPVSLAIASRWKLVGGTEKPLACTLSFAEYPDWPMGVTEPFRTVDALLACGSLHAGTSLSLELPLSKRIPPDVLSQRLVELMAVKLCAANAKASKK